ncbi:CaiB/BaiF CoA transferase family protein [Paramicrobacterium chengjingii]|uniref:CoA transferase n=1 Tax=Paramicrobacterium chengjingii TaxID=2769067 RepID=A0ABX6YHH4_9MICO|nr:CoA transferase [Microbacterium chengjingii]QPZ38249.1 CoA transferase [Microbacterium chengjingii]
MKDEHAHVTNRIPWDPKATGVLTGIKVLDLSRFIAGPLCAQHLADLGADVIKVEGLNGEDSRQNDPRVNGESLYTALFNRNKRALTLNTRTEKGRSILTELVEWADVLVENFRPGTLAKMGLDKSTLAKLNPALIIASISGYGADSPLHDKVLFDCIAQASTGLMTLNSQGDGKPLLTKIASADVLSGVYTALGVLAALRHRDLTGEGQTIDLSVYDSLFSATGTPVPAYVSNGTVPPLNGNRDDFNAPANVFRTEDGYVYLHAGTQAFWKRFCEDIVGRPCLVDHPDFATVDARMRNRVGAERIVEQYTEQHVSADVEKEFAECGIPCAAVLDIPEVAASAQPWARNMLFHTTDASGEELVLIGNPVKLSNSPVSMRLAPPRLGEHTDSIMIHVLDKTPADVIALHEEGVI